MTCRDDARLLYAYGEPCADRDRRHIERCPDCRREVDVIRGISRSYRRRRPMAWAALLMAAVSLFVMVPAVSAPVMNGRAIDRSIAEIRSKLAEKRPAAALDRRIESLKAKISQISLDDETF